MSRNPIFDRLVGENDTDLEALTAYALYKKHKRQWAKEIEAETGSLPTTAQDIEFYKAVGTSDQLDRYRKDAQDILLAYANQMVESAVPGIRSDAVSGRIEQAAAKIEESAGIWRSVKSGFVSTLISTAVLILLAVGIRLLGIDILSAYNSLGTVPGVGN